MLKNYETVISLCDLGFSLGSVVKNLPANAGDPGDAGSISGARKIPWRRKWQPTPVLLPGKFHGQRNMGSRRVGHNSD